MPSNGEPGVGQVPMDDGATLVASFLLGAAGLAHLSVAPAHVAEWWAFGALFGLAAVVQLGLAVALLHRPTRLASSAAVAACGALILTWLASRTVGLPIGPEPGAVEPVGFLDLVTTLAELMLIAIVGLTAAGLGARGSRRPLVACEVLGIGLGFVLTLAFAGGVGHG